MLEIEKGQSSSSHPKPAFEERTGGSGAPSQNQVELQYAENSARHENGTFDFGS